MKKTIIHFFSGTGNTARAVGLAKAALEEAGRTVELRLIGTSAPEDNGDADEELFAFPALGFAAPVMVKRYLKRLPRRGGRPAAALCVCAGGPAQSLGQAERILERRGYAVAISGYAAYPVNWTQMLDPPDEAASGEKLKSGDAEVLAFARDWIAGVGRFQSPGFGTQLWSGFVSFAFGMLGRRILGKAFIADGSCTRCGLCAKACPAGTIGMDGKGGLPRWKANCENCNRCINVCPAQALQSSALRFKLHAGINLVLTAASVYAGVRLGGVLGDACGAWAGVPGGIAAAGAIYAAACALQLTLADRLIGVFQAAFPAPFLKSATSSFRRYRAPGWTPPELKN